jgi:hypothetical protein
LDWGVGGLIFQEGLGAIGSQFWLIVPLSWLIEPLYWSIDQRSQSIKEHLYFHTKYF